MGTVGTILIILTGKGDIFLMLLRYVQYFSSKHLKAIKLPADASTVLTGPGWQDASPYPNSDYGTGDITILNWVVIASLEYFI